MTNEAKILIAEDDENDRFFLERAFSRKAGELSLTFANDGQETIDHLKQWDRSSANAADRPPELLLLDIKMPRLNGFQVLDWLRQQGTHRPAKIIVLSSSDEATDMKRAKDLGADLYMVKPNNIIGYDKLAEEMKKVVEEA